jgi:hypothetical protein
MKERPPGDSRPGGDAAILDEQAAARPQFSSGKARAKTRGDPRPEITKSWEVIVEESLIDPSRANFLNEL